MCRTCRQNCRIVKFDFQCAKLYHDYVNSSSFKKPDLGKCMELVCLSAAPWFIHFSHFSLFLQSGTVSHHRLQWIGHMARNHQGGNEYCVPHCRHIVHRIWIAPRSGAISNGIDERLSRQTTGRCASTTNQPLFIATTWTKLHFGRSRTIDFQEFLLFHYEIKSSIFLFVENQFTYFHIREK